MTTIDETAPITATKRIEVDAPPEAVYDLVARDRFEELPGGGTLVTTEESWAGPVARIFRRPLSKQLDSALEGGLELLKREAERA